MVSFKIVHHKLDIRARIFGVVTYNVHVFFKGNPPSTEYYVSHHIDYVSEYSDKHGD